MDTNFSFRDFFSDRKNIFMTIGVVLLLILIPVLGNLHHTPSEKKGFIPADQLAEAYLQDPQKAEKYVGKKVKLSQIPESADSETGATILFSVGDGGQLVPFTFHAGSPQDRRVIQSLDLGRTVTVSGTIQSVRAGEGYQISVQDIDGTLSESFASITTQKTTETEDYDAPPVDSYDYDPEETAASAPGPVTVQTQGNHAYLVQDGARISDYTGLYSCTIGGKKKLYYFQDGVYRPKHNGIEEYEGTTYMVYHGAVKSDFTGNYVLDGQTYSIVKGVVQE